MPLSFYAFNVVFVLSILTVAGQCIAVTLAIAFIIDTAAPLTSPVVVAGFRRHLLTTMLLVALTATLGSLFFSEIAGWTPCKDCWLQRIFMYPQVVMLMIAVWKRDRGVAKYVLALCVFGAAIAAFHYAIQMQNLIASPTNPATPCDASGVSCVKTPFVEFGYITIPLMSFTAFCLNGLGSLCLLRPALERRGTDPSIV